MTSATPPWPPPGGRWPPSTGPAWPTATWAATAWSWTPTGAPGWSTSTTPPRSRPSGCARPTWSSCGSAWPPASARTGPWPAPSRPWAPSRWPPPWPAPHPAPSPRRPARNWTTPPASGTGWPAGSPPRRPSRRPTATPRSGVDLLALPDDDHAAVGDHEPLPVPVEVDADPGPLGDLDVLVEDGVADHRSPADVGVVHQHRPLDAGPGVDPDPRRQDRAAHRAPRHHHPGRDHRVERVPGAALAVLEHELGRGQRLVPGEDRPAPVVEVEHRVDRDQVHVGVVVGVQGADVPPVAAVPVGAPGHVVGGVVVDLGLLGPDQHGDDVAAQVVLGVLVLGVQGDRLDQGV